MNADGADFTNTFRALAAVDAEADAPGSIPPALQEVQMMDRVQEDHQSGVALPVQLSPGTLTLH